MLLNSMVTHSKKVVVQFFVLGLIMVSLVITNHFTQGKWPLQSPVYASSFTKAGNLGVGTTSPDIGLTINPSSVNVTITQSVGVGETSMNSALTITSTGASQFVFSGYPTSYGVGINWLPTSGGIQVNQSIPVSISIDSSVGVGTYTGTGNLGVGTTGPQISFPVTVNVISISPTVTPTPTPLAKRVFVTSTVYNGNLGGVSGADTTCQVRANKVNLGGVWKAWLSDNNTSASLRLTHSDGAYTLIDGTLVANNWAGLTSGTLMHSINTTEKGTKPSYYTNVWTGTGTQGENGYPDCQNWTSSSYPNKGLIGADYVTNSYWTLGTASDICKYQARLYCIEQ